MTDIEKARSDLQDALIRDLTTVVNGIYYRSSPWGQGKIQSNYGEHFKTINDAHAELYDGVRILNCELKGDV
jgi:hypothetical protein